MRWRESRQTVQCPQCHGSQVWNQALVGFAWQAPRDNMVNVPPSH
ncbi:hypothetical protein RRSWK_00953 [Rhodopirellula sp. SWK7]|nr:hypothetical protein RRSWK_00953 [Rhodopirellula sp. SWK7]